MPKKPRFTLITGASSGIGLEFANQLAAKDKNLILVARSTDKLKKIKKDLESEFEIEVKIYTADLSDLTEIDTFFKKIEKEDLTIETLINNAGFGTHGEFIKNDISKEINMINLNISSLVKMTHLFLPKLKKIKGQILNVASTAAFQPIPNMACYAATKSFVLSFSQAIREELKGTGISVTTLCPGATKTAFFEEAKMDTTKGAFARTMMTVEEVVKMGIEALEKRKDVVVPGISNSLGTVFAKMLPSAVSASVAKKIMG